MSLLHQLTTITHKSKKRVGRGYGSGKGGHTVGRGVKGQRSRQGGGVPIWFEGGQLPIIKRLPMIRGKGRFKSVRQTAEIKVGELNNIKTDTITLDTLKLEKIIDSRFKKAKIIKGGGALTKKVTIKGIRVSQAARHQIEQAGGVVSDS